MRLTRAPGASLYWICLAVLLAAFLDLAWLGWATTLDARLSDAMIRMRAASRSADPEIVIVDIDDRSLAVMADKVGRFPWPRSVYGEVLAELDRQGARAVVMDVELYEPDAVRPEQDQFLNEALLGSTNTFFPIRLLERIDAEEGVEIAAFAERLDLAASPDADPHARVPMQLPFVLDQAAWSRTGLVNYVEDADGVGRRYWLVRDVDGWRIPSLPARVATALGYPLPDGESFRLDWFRGVAPHEQVSFSDFYEDLERASRTRDPDEFRGDIVVIGSSSNHLRDFRTTPVASLFPGVEILATAIDNLKNGERLTETTRAAPYALVLMLVAPLFAVLRRRWNLVPVLGLLVAATIVFLGGAWFALGQSVLVPVGTPLVFGWLFFFAAALRAYLKEQRAKEQRERVLSRFLDPRLVKSLVADGVTLEDFKSESRSITILFSDMRGFTTLSETRPAEEVVDLLNRYFTLQTETVFRHGGTLDKFIGDAIMAFWNAPTDDAQHPVHAVACALDMVRTLARFNAENAASGIDLDIGIGVHTGPAVVGFVGSQRKLEYTAIGDTVNLASRLESETKGRARVLVSRATRDACGEAFRFSDLGSMTVKGRQAAVQVFAPAPATNSAEAA